MTSEVRGERLPDGKVEPRRSGAASWLLQPWSAIGGGALASVTQTETGWLDLASVTDVEVILSVRQTTPNLHLYYETSPSRDADLFASMADLNLELLVGARHVLVVRFASAAEPLARWLRWRLEDFEGDDFVVTFRIWVRCVRTARDPLLVPRRGEDRVGMGMWGPYDEPFPPDRRSGEVVGAVQVAPPTGDFPPLGPRPRAGSHAASKRRSPPSADRK